ncbi:MAG: hypothetical protein IJC13_02095 [Clostridia bacterium]|nr:hypothetical protein [Clostridia bacterium]
MELVIVQLITGIVLSVFGFLQMTGYINAVRVRPKRGVTPHEIKKLQSLVGRGILFVGFSFLFMGAFLLVALILKNNLFFILGLASLLLFLLAGGLTFFLSFWKYSRNKY